MWLVGIALLRQRLEWARLGRVCGSQCHKSSQMSTFKQSQNSIHGTNFKTKISLQYRKNFKRHSDRSVSVLMLTLAGVCGRVLSDGPGRSALARGALCLRRRGCIPGTTPPPLRVKTVKARFWTVKARFWTANKTIKARFWPWMAGESPENTLRCSLEGRIDPGEALSLVARSASAVAAASQVEREGGGSKPTYCFL